MKHFLTTRKGVICFASFKTNITTRFEPILRLHRSITTIYVLFMGLQSVSAQCPAPSGLTTLNIGQNTASLRWTSTAPNTPTDNCWAVTLGGVGMTLEATGCPQGGQALFSTTVCYLNNVTSFTTPVTGMTVVGNQITITVGGLPPGTSLQWFVSETCDDVAPPNNVSNCSASLAFTTLDPQYTVAAVTVKPGCPFVSPGYAPDGSFTVTVTNGSACAGTYTVNATPVAGSGPAGSTPPNTATTTYIGAPAGAFFFGNAGAGSYTVTVTETGPCNPPTDPVVVIVTVPDGMDMVAPVFYVTDVLGNILADNDPLTAPGVTRNFGSVTIPDGECGRQDEYYAYGFDNCDGFIVANNAVTASATTIPNLSPGTQVSVTPDGFGFYLVDVHWGIGTSTVTIRGRDASGNIANAPAGLQLVMTIPDNVDPVVTILGPSQVTIPVCATSLTAIITIQVDDLCNQNVVDFANLIFLVGNGATFVTNFTGNNYREYFVRFHNVGPTIITTSYTDAFGNVGFTDQIINIQQATANQPPVIQANAETVTLAACQTCQMIVYSFVISDDCAPVNPAQVQFNGGGSGLPNHNGSGFFFTDPVGCPGLPCNSVYFEVWGCAGPAGTYFPLITYQGITANPTITVLQSANQPAEIVNPAVNLTIPQCQSEVDAIIPISIYDDCDNPINPANATFTLCGQAITPDFTNAATGYFEFARTLTVAENGCLLVATYTDAQGVVGTVDALITVHAQPDLWAPIIVYPSQDIILDLNPCDPSLTTINFEVTVADNCTNGILPNISLNTGFPVVNTGGNTYAVTLPPGSHQATITATDAAGNVRQEDFSIVISQEASEPTQLACQSALNIALNDVCEAMLTPEMLLTGTFGCLDAADFIIQVADSDSGNGPLVDGCGTFNYHISLQPGLTVPGFTECWGVVNTDDLTPPSITCPANTNQITLAQTYQELSGALAATDGTFQPGQASCWLQFFNPVPATALHFYDTHTFTVTETDVYTFDLYDPNGGDWIGGIYRDGFNPQNPCLDVISQQDPGTLALGLGSYTAPFGLVFANGLEPRWRISLTLQAGTTYTLATTSFGANSTGAYTWRVYSAGNGQLTGLPLLTTSERRTLLCEDQTQIILSTLPANVPRCYKTDGDGNVIFPINPQQRQRYQQLLDRLAYTGYPNANTATALGGSVSDNDDCGFIEICVTETTAQAGDCTDFVITRTFTAKDEQDGDFDAINNTPCIGAPNTALCVQEIRVRKPQVVDIILPPYTALFECGEDFPEDQNGNPHPDISGYPIVRRAFGVEVINQVYCNLAASYFDTPHANVCAQGYKFLRQWTLFDWCFPAQSIIYAQTVKVGDRTPPVVVCPLVDNNADGIPDPLVYSTDGGTGCTSAFVAPLPQVTDNCSAWSVFTEIVTEVIVGNDTQVVVLAAIAADAPTRFVSDIPLGCHSFRYTVADECGNTTVLDCEFCVVDETDPTAVCNDDLNISIGGDGHARIYTSSIDEGSSDDCGIAQLQVRRLLTSDPGSCAPIAPVYTPWGDYVDASCCDVGRNILIELLVTDEAGNTNTCWMTVLVEDKIKPTCSAPPSVTIACSDLPNNFNPQDTLQAQALFGAATASDNCPGAYIRELTPLYSLNECGFGTMVRRFQAVDAAGNVSDNCSQLITVAPMFNYEIAFPKDAASHCGTPMPDTITHWKYGCDLLAVSVTDETLVASEDECYKLLRKYRVINWCEYNGVDAPVVVSRDEDCDNNPGDEAVWVLRRPNETYIDRDNNELNHNPAAGVKNTQCDGTTNPEGYWRTSRSAGFWEYTQSIKVYDTIPPRVYFAEPPPFCSYDNVDCNVEIEYKFLLAENCTPSDLEMLLFYDEGFDGIIDEDVPEEGIAGQYPKFEVTKEYPIGSHAFVLQLTDGCGNTSRTNLPFQVVDCKAPNPVCINGLSIPLMRADPDTDVDGDGITDTGVAVIEATDFLVSPLSDCLGPIRYSINFLGESPDVNRTSLTFTCAHIGPQTVEIYGWDQAFNPYAVQPDGTVGGPNYDHCTTFIIVQDNEVDACPGSSGGSSAVMGRIETENLDPVANVSVQVSSGATAPALTDASGLYFLSGLYADYDYTVIPELDSNPLNGISTLDLVLITKHILNEQALDSPYKLIAADIDGSNHITTIDLILLRRLILALDDDFTQNTSWRFVPRSYVFPDPANPWAPVFPEFININDLPGTVLSNQDFVAVKIGDVNGSAVPDLFGSTELRSEIAASWTLSAFDRTMSVGETVDVPIYPGDLQNLESLQFTLGWNETLLDFVALRPGAAGMEHIGQRFLMDGYLTLSWDGAVHSDHKELLTLTLRAKKPVKLSEALHLAPGPTPSEAWHQQEGRMGVALSFQSGDKAALMLYPNQPNPFRESTTIRFFLPEAGEAELVFYTSSGQVLKRITGTFPKGENTVSLNRAELSAAGLIFYELRTENGERAVSRMVIQE